MGSLKLQIEEAAKFINDNHRFMNRYLAIASRHMKGDKSSRYSDLITLLHDKIPDKDIARKTLMNMVREISSDPGEYARWVIPSALSPMKHCGSDCTKRTSKGEVFIQNTHIDAKMLMTEVLWELNQSGKSLRSKSTLRRLETYNLGRWSEIRHDKDSQILSQIKQATSDSSDISVVYMGWVCQIYEYLIRTLHSKTLALLGRMGEDELVKVIKLRMLENDGDGEADLYKTNWSSANHSEYADAKGYKKLEVVNAILQHCQIFNKGDELSDEKQHWQDKMAFKKREAADSGRISVTAEDVPLIDIFFAPFLRKSQSDTFTNMTFIPGSFLTKKGFSLLKNFVEERLSPEADGTPNSECKRLTFELRSTKSHLESLPGLFQFMRQHLGFDLGVDSEKQAAMRVLLTSKHQNILWRKALNFKGSDVLSDPPKSYLSEAFRDGHGELPQRALDLGFDTRPEPTKEYRDWLRLEPPFRAFRDLLFLSNPPEFPVDDQTRKPKDLFMPTELVVQWGPDLCKNVVETIVVKKKTTEATCENKNVPVEAKRFALILSRACKTPPLQIFCWDAENGEILALPDATPHTS